VRKAVRVLDLEALRWLRTPPGVAAVALARRLQEDGVDLLHALDRLRPEVGTDLAGPAWDVAKLREVARPKFGADAEVMWFTVQTLEQAGRPELAARRAARLLPGGTPTVADLGCASGTDTVALARAGATVLAVDRDPVARELTTANVEALGLADRVEVRDADVVGFVAEGLPGCDAATLDPARRSDGRRTFDPRRWSPPWSTVTALLEKLPASVVKVAPGLDHDLVPDGVEAEWVSVGGSIVEALLWGSDRAETWRRATLVRDGAVLELTADADPGRAPAGPVQGWLHEPDPAIIRSGLVSLVAADLDATLIDPMIAYLTSGNAADSPWVRSYRIDDVLPFNLKKLKALLKARGVGRVVVKKRGSRIEPETLARQLRGLGRGTATVVVTRVAGEPTALVCDLSDSRSR
jgi:SAM-dependent methyltransferase